MEYRKSDCKQVRRKFVPVPQATYFQADSDLAG
jgi:hypothetical protein